MNSNQTLLQEFLSSTSSSPSSLLETFSSLFSSSPSLPSPSSLSSPLPSPLPSPTSPPSSAIHTSSHQHNNININSNINSASLHQQPRFPYQALREISPVSHDLWDLLDAKLAELREYLPASQKNQARKQIAVCGAGIAGLRSAIQLLLLGNDVTIVEKRREFNRHNVIRLWPSTIHDLKSIGVKTVFRKFCFGGVEHVGIGTLQMSLLKIALLLGAKVHLGYSLKEVLEPGQESTLWQVNFAPHSKPGLQERKEPPGEATVAAVGGEEGGEATARGGGGVPHPGILALKAEILIGAEGEVSPVADLFGFVKKESRAGEAIGITANFINHHSQEEEALPEQSIAYYFNQALFQQLEDASGLKLENLVYFRGLTHYFVITAKRDSLLERGVLLENLKDLKELTAPGNVRREALEEVMKRVAVFSGLQEDTLTYAVGHHLQHDVQLFDFSTKHQCELPAKAILHDREGKRVPGLLVFLVGDSLVAPFWPQGTGGNRAVLAALDTAWAVMHLKDGALSSTDEVEAAKHGEEIQEVLKSRLEAYTLMLTSGPETLVTSSLSHFDPSKRYKHGGISLV